MSVYPDQRAVAALREWLFYRIPSAAIALESTRGITFTTPTSSIVFRDPDAIPSGSTLTVGTSAVTTASVSLGVANSLTSIVNLINNPTGAEVPEPLISGVSASLVTETDGSQRMRVTLASTPSDATPTTPIYLSLSCNNATASRMLGFGAGSGIVIRRYPILWPATVDAISDGEPELVDLGAGFWVVLGDRSVRPRSDNIKDDTHIVEIDTTIYAAEPGGSAAASHEYLQACVSSVRDAILADRTLGGRVYLTAIPSLSVSGQTFRFNSPGGASPLISVAKMLLRVTVFERT